MEDLLPVGINCKLGWSSAASPGYFPLLKERVALEIFLNVVSGDLKLELRNHCATIVSGVSRGKPQQNMLHGLFLSSIIQNVTWNVPLTLIGLEICCNFFLKTSCY